MDALEALEKIQKKIYEDPYAYVFELQWIIDSVDEKRPTPHVPDAGDSGENN